MASAHGRLSDRVDAGVDYLYHWSELVCAGDNFVRVGGAMIVTPVRTEQEYLTALAELEQLMDAEPGSPEEDRLEVLGTLVWAYEQKHHPIDKPDPIAALEYYLESRGLDQKALEPYIGRPNRVWEIMNKRRPLSKEMIRKLEAGTGIPASVLIQPYELDLEPMAA